MIYKGQRFTRSQKVVEIRRSQVSDDLLRENGYKVLDEPFHYFIFGRVCEKEDEGAIETDYTWSHTDEPVYAQLVPCDGYSRTNLMYGADDYMYLMYNGSFYVRKYYPPKERYIRVEPLPEDEQESLMETLDQLFAGAETLYRVVGRHRSLPAAFRAVEDGQRLYRFNLPLGGYASERKTGSRMPQKHEVFADFMLDVFSEEDLTNEV